MTKTTKTIKRFTPGQKAEYGMFIDKKLGGSWHDCKIVEVDAVGKPTKIEAKNGKGEWLPAFEPGHGHSFRHPPSDPWVLRHREPSTLPNGQKRFSYFVQVSRYFPAMQIGSFAEAYRFATARDAHKALAQIGAPSGWLVLRVATTVRDENELRCSPDEGHAPTHGEVIDLLDKLAERREEALGGAETDERGSR